MYAQKIAGMSKALELVELLKVLKFAKDHKGSQQRQPLIKFSPPCLDVSCLKFIDKIPFMW